MDLEIKDWIALLAILASLAVGVRNWVVTTSIRTGTIRLEEFRSQIRDPIQKKMDKLGEVREALSALQRPNGSTDEQLRAGISQQVASLEFTLLDLVDLFDHADRSSFADGRNWRSRYSVKLDEVAKRLGHHTVDAGFDRMAAGAAIADTTRAIADVAGELRLRFEHEVKSLVPPGLFSTGRHRSPPR